MTLRQFISKYLGKQVEVAGSASAKYQCVDLVNAYIREMLGAPIVEWTDAKDFLKNASMEHFIPIANTPSFIPKPGDIVVWNGRVGQGHGHIAIVTKANINNFESLDQNWSKPLWVTKETHNYNNVIGFLRHKNLSDGVPSLDKEIITNSNNWNYLRKKYDISDPKQIDDKIASYEKEAYACSQLNSKLEKKIRENEKEIANLEYKSTQWEHVKEAYNVKDFTELSEYVKGLIELAEDSSGCQKMIDKVEEKYVKQMGGLRKQFAKQKELLKKQIKLLKDYKLSELIAEVLKRLFTKR